MWLQLENMYVSPVPTKDMGEGHFGGPTRSAYELPVMCMLALSQLRKCRHLPSPSFDPVFMKDAQYVLNRMKKQYSDFYFSSYRKNSSEIGVKFSTKMTIPRKMKIGNI